MKLKYLLVRTFPPYSFYKENYPVAAKLIIPILFIWLRRFFRGFTKLRKIADEIDHMK